MCNAAGRRRAGLKTIPLSPGSLSGVWAGYAESQMPEYSEPAAIQASLQA